MGSFNGASPAPVVLASASPARAALLSGAGVSFIIDKAAIDEAAVKKSLRADDAPAALVAETLAELKAKRVSSRHPGALVIGADQILECGGEWFDKPADMDHGRAHLRALRGKAHALISAVCVVRDGQRIWHGIDSARLVMRSFSDEFLDSYLTEAGSSVLDSVGAYRLEDRGAQLFARIDGDYFTILGLPLLELLEYLRNQGVLKK